MTLRILAVDARQHPVDVDPTEPLHLTLAEISDDAPAVDLSITTLEHLDPIWHRQVRPTDSQISIDDLRLSGEQAYLATATLPGQPETTTSHGFRTAPDGPWSDAHSIWAPGRPTWCLLRREIQLPDEPIAWATLFATAASPEPYRQYVHVTSINGSVIGSGPTRSIADETRFDGFDATPYLYPGANAINVTACTTQGHQFLARLVVAYHNGLRVEIGTDTSWRAHSAGRMFHAAGDLGTICYQLPAENLDLRRYPWGFERPGFDDTAWAEAEIRPPLKDLTPTPTQKVEHHAVQPQTVTHHADGRVVVDFGRTWLGGLRLRTNHATGPITIRYSERLHSDGTVRHQLHSGNIYEETLIADGTDRTVQPWGMRVFRYAEIIGLPAPPESTDLAAVAQIYPLSPTQAAFTSSDPILNEIWQLSAHSIRALNGNLYVDSWTRERLVYEADVYLQQRAHLCLGPDPSLGRYSTAYVAHNRTWPTEWPFYTVLAWHDNWMRTGDTSHASRMFDQVLDLLPDRYLDPVKGLVTKLPGENSALDGDLVDWPPVERHGYQFGHVNTVVNALAAAAYQAAAELAAATGRTEAARLASTASTLKASIGTYLYDPEHGAFVDGLDQRGNRLCHHSVHASAFALWSGVVPQHHSDQIAAHLQRHGLACSVYAAAFVIDGLFAHGNGQTALDLLTSTGTRSWARMLELGAGATMEAWNETIKPNLSHSHPWGASPAFLALEGVLGLRPLTPGYRTFSAQPQLGHLDYASGALPTVAGTIAVEARRRGTHLLVDLTVPTGLEATLRHEDGTEALRASGGHHQCLVRAAAPLR
ncbi:family 78 glycoside hydrolase catalytic domain [Actinopolymorpha sp. B11F2]|uniref:family 78 glycoside hydrolase catalytic domain n=1 Tax=Actinopolymorpha sp. B11F2 TaxID=3160862 RepID=UPI0032E47AAA